MNWLYGKRGYSLIDVWTLVHLAFWIFFGSCFWPSTHAGNVSRWLVWVGCIALAYGWEVFERFAEKKWPNLWLNPESWWNAYVMDPLTCAVGVPLIWWLLDSVQ